MWLRVESELSCSMENAIDMREELDRVIQNGVEWSFRQQREGGLWVAPLESSIWVEVHWLLMLHLTGATAGEAKVEAMMHCIRSKQRPDGSWDVYNHAPAGDINTTIECYVAMKAHGARATESHMVAARDWILAHGGISHQLNIFTKLWLAMVGEWSWDDVSSLPPEFILLPHWAPISIYHCACWARLTLVPMLVISAKRVLRPLPPDRACYEIHPPLPTKRSSDSSTSMAMSDRLFQLLNTMLRWYGNHCPFKPGRATAIDYCIKWMLERQEVDGNWLYAHCWLLNIIALQAEGYGLEHPVLQKALGAFDSEKWAMQTEDGLNILQVSTSPVWDTACTLVALLDCGVDVRDPRFARSIEYILSKEVRIRGDWAVSMPTSVAPGGWSFNHENEFYPDVDDTAVVMNVLMRSLSLGYPDPQGRVKGALERALGWVKAMVCRNGGWAAFDKDNTSTYITWLPFCDFGDFLDQPSVDITAHVVEVLVGMGMTMKDPLVKNAVRFIRAEQEEDGSWFGRWAVNHVYGTGTVLPALKAAGEDMESAYILKAGSWLVAHQNEDGGWGETCESYMDIGLRGVGPSTASQTGWALIGLIAAAAGSQQQQDRYSDAIRKGVAYFGRTQTGRGSWSDGGQFTGTGHPGYAIGARIDLRTSRTILEQGTELSRGYMLRYHMYQHYFPLMALGRARSHFSRLKSQPTHSSKPDLT